LPVLDGSTYLRRTSALSGVSNSKTCVLSGWFLCAAGEGGTILVGGAGAQTYVSLDISTSTGFLTFTLTNAATTDIWGVTTDTDYADGALHHYGISVDLGNSRAQFYVDGAAATVTTNTAAADDTIAFTSATEWVVGASLAGAAPFTGSLWDIGIWPGKTLDLSDNDEINLIVALDSAQGLRVTPSRVKPVGYGIEGRNLGVPAGIFVSNFQRNYGTGGTLALTGYPDEDAYPDGPNPWRLHAQRQTPGVVWVASEQSGDPYPINETVVENREGLTNYGKRIGLDEVDDPTRQERPGMDWADLLLGREDADEGDYFR